MKILYVGGQKSGKSRLAEEKIIEIAPKNPYYLATYHDIHADIEMQRRIQKHRQRREGKFITIQEPIAIDEVIKEGESYLVDCLSMWILNLIENKEDFEKRLDNLLAKDVHIVFVLNSVNEGIIPPNTLSRRYVDMSGIIGQIVAKHCDEVYEVIVGIPRRLK